MTTTKHLPYDVARMLGPDLAVIPGQRTIKSECGQRVAIDRVSWDAATCTDCLHLAIGTTTDAWDAVLSIEEPRGPRWTEACQSLRAEHLRLTLMLAAVAVAK